MRTILKSVIGLLAVSISFCSFAYEATPGVKIISERFESHGFKNGHIESLPVKKNSKMNANATTMTSDAQGHLMENIPVNSWHDVSISNYTSGTKRYTYTYVLACEDMSQTFSRTVDIPPQGNFADSAHNYGDVQKEETGTFRIMASTQISGGDSAFHNANAILRVTK